jgi:hypothetical protein
MPQRKIHINMARNITIKRDSFSLLTIWFVLSILLLIVLIVIKLKLFDNSILGFGVVINFILMLLLVGRFRLKRLTLNKDEKCNIIEMDKWSVTSKMLKVPLSEIVISFKEEHRARGIKTKVLKIFRNN